jgi:hypothetical protein
MNKNVCAQEPVKAIGKYLTINYKPFFPIGLYSFPDRRQDDAIWKEAADAGFNFVLSEQSGKYGIYVARAVPWKTINNQKVSLMELYRDNSLLPELKDFLAKNENDPTVLCWHAPDEPCWFGPSANVLQAGYEAIKANSKKPVWLNVGPSFTQIAHFSPARDHYRACDIISEDIYPIPEEKNKPSQGYNRYAYFVGEHTKNLVELGSIDGVPNTPVWMVLQGFAWGDLTQEKNIKDLPAPTLHQIRYMYYDAIVHGATGILIWGVRSTKTEHGAQIWKDLKTMASELRDNYSVWTCPFELLPEKLKVSLGDNSTQENPVRWMIKLVDDKVVILAVNTRNVPLKNVTFSTIQGGVLSKVKVLTENRDVQVANKNSWTDNFEGYGVHIYETDIFFSFMRRYYKDPNAPANPARN